MTGEEYLSKLNNLWENINKDNIDEKKQEINTLSKIIPKRLKYFAVQARLHQLEGNDRGMYEALQILMEKYWGLYYYNGLKEIYDCYIYNSQYYNDYEDVRRLVYDFSHISLTKEQTQYEQILRQGIKSFYENGGDCASMEQLASIMYIRNDYVMYVILKYAIHKIYDKELSIRKWVKDITNIGYLTERLDDDSSVYIVIVSDNNGEICDVLANVLALLEKKVFVIRQPEIVETSKKLTEGEILRISIENKEEYDEFTVYPAVKAMCENNEYCDNTGNLINYISESLTENHLATLLCSGECFNNLEKDPILKKNTSRLFGYRNDYYETEMSFGWTGDYLSYISVIYKSDFKKVFMKSPQCDFSIVIPARNSAYTLRYTIMTCLNIEYRGSYEIVISDNSSDFNRDVYNLVREFNDEKIKYYSGHATYRGLFRWKNEQDGRIILRLGKVANVATVRVNSIACGTAWTAPDEVDITDALRNGTNVLEVEVVNTWANALRGADQDKAPFEGIWTNAKFRLPGDDLLPAGWMGPCEFFKTKE